jgi:cell division protein FtsZ
VTFDEITEITEFIQEEAGYGTDLIWGNCKDETLGEKLCITLIATGFKEGGHKKPEQKAQETVKVSLENDRNTTSYYRSQQNVEDEMPAVFDFDEVDSGNVVDFDTDDVRKTIDMLGVKPSADYYPRRDAHLTEEMKKRSEADAARREYLRKNNSKPLDNPKIISDMEATPAYARRNVMLDETHKHNGRQQSSYTVSMDDDNNMFMSNNAYLYDNVD